MVKHTNFYETLQEARMRLENTLIMYDDEPYYIVLVDDHKSDGIFRGYLDPVTKDGLEPFHRKNHMPCHDYEEEPGSRGRKMDKWMDANSSPIIRKMMNSPKFNNFRPFPLGMVNSDGSARYLVRTPTRHTQQGLTNNMLEQVSFDILDTGRRALPNKYSIYGRGMYDCIKANHPDFSECMTNLTSSECSNTSVAFNRDFAVVRGPMNILFLAYRGDIVGFLPNNNESEVKIAKEFEYVKEVVDELSLFTRIS